MTIDAAKDKKNIPCHQRHADVCYLVHRMSETVIKYSTEINVGVMYAVLLHLLLSNITLALTVNLVGICAGYSYIVSTAERTADDPEKRNYNPVRFFLHRLHGRFVTLGYISFFLSC